MALFRRGLPPAARPALVRGERVLAWSSTSGASTSDTPSGTVVVTNVGVWLPGRTERLGWHQIHKATWSGGRLTIVPSTFVSAGKDYAVLADDAAVDVSLADPGDVPAIVRERVTKSVFSTAHHDLPGGGVRIVARRVPGVDGVEWHVRYDEGTDVDDPDIVSATEDLVTAAALALRPE
jgi:hypothetical protein